MINLFFGKSTKFRVFYMFSVITKTKYGNQIEGFCAMYVRLLLWNTYKLKLLLNKSYMMFAD